LHTNLDYLAFAVLALGAFACVQWVMRGRQARLRPTVWLLVAAILVLGWWPVNEAGRAERRRIEAMVGGMAPTYAQTLQTMGHAKIGPGTPPEDSSYLAMIEIEKRWLKANPAAHDIYTMRKLPDGRNVFIVDSETDYNGNGVIDGEAEGRTAIGEEYKQEDEGMERAFAGNANFDEVPVTDRWGTWVSAWTPLYDDAGRVEAVLGVDFSADDWGRGIAAARLARIAQLAVLLMLLGSSAYVNGMLHADIEKRQRIEADLRRSRGRLALRAEQTPLAVIEWNLDFQVTDWNAAAERLFGFTRSEAVGAAMLDQIAPASVRAEIAAMRDGRPGTKPAAPCTDAHVTKDGREIVCAWFNAPLVDGGCVIGVTSLCEDVTERRKLEEQLRQAQKMEAFGQLAGGIAHDFNNMLCVIQGFTDLVRNRSDVPADAVADLHQVAGSAERAADLTRQLLTFSRRQIFQPKSVNLNAVVQQVTNMLRRVLGDDVNLETNFMPKLPEVHGDTGMIEQALVNLTVNARDAMPKGGRLAISTSSRFVGAAEAARHARVEPGPFVCLEVADSGSGIAPEHLPHIFDPFFTTKEVGRGTGLGLATVFGIVEQHHGWVGVESEPGRGTTFRIFFPAVAETKDQDQVETEAPPAAGGHETILVVEDEMPVRDFVTRLLAGRGYEVLTAGTGTEALDVWREHHDRIQMLFTDMIMPDGFSGADLARQLRREDAGLKIIYTSGYSMDFMSRKVSLLPGVNFLQKPYAPQQLIRAVRENLDREEPVAAL
jgi:PAS domain S-box-containing protein